MMIPLELEKSDTGKGALDKASFSHHTRVFFVLQVCLVLCKVKFCPSMYDFFTTLAGYARLAQVCFGQIWMGLLKII